MNIGIIGVGKYSLAIAKQLAKKSKNNIIMWTESNDIYGEYKKTNKLKSIFDVKLDDNISITDDLKKAVIKQDIIYIITASKYVDITCNNIKEYYDKSVPICIASKGIEDTTEQILSEVVHEKLRTRHIAVISGPTFAIDMINNEPICLALAAKSIKAKNYVLKTLPNDSLKLRVSSDMIGIQICGAVKNVVAIASGILNGLGYSESTEAFLINESLHDIKNIIYYFGGKKKTILSYAGVGDILLTCTSKKSRNYSFGHLIGSTKNKNDIKEYLNNNTVEGYDTLAIIYRILKNKGVNIEFINVLYDIVYNLDDPHKLTEFLIIKK